MPTLEKKEMLEVNHLVAGYAGMPVVHDVSFIVKEGQIVGLVGANGSGKSTTLKAVTGLIKPNSGTILYKNKNIVGIKPHKLVELGVAMVPEGRHLFGKLSVKDNLLMGAYLIKDKQRKAKTFEEVYSIFPILKEREGQLTETLSGGEQQMVALARGLMSEPELLILDEPSLGLSPILVQEVFGLIRKINEIGVTIILVEQNVNETLSMADYAYVIQNGETIIQGSGKELLGNEEVKKAYLGL